MSFGVSSTGPMGESDRQPIIFRWRALALQVTRNSRASQKNPAPLGRSEAPLQLARSDRDCIEPAAGHHSRDGAAQRGHVERLRDQHVGDRVQELARAAAERAPVKKTTFATSSGKASTSAAWKSAPDIAGIIRSQKIRSKRSPSRNRLSASRASLRICILPSRSRVGRVANRRLPAPRTFASLERVPGACTTPPRGTCLADSGPLGRAKASSHDTWLRTRRRATQRTMTPEPRRLVEFVSTRSPLDCKMVG